MNFKEQHLCRLLLEHQQGWYCPAASQWLFGLPHSFFFFFFLQHNLLNCPCFCSANKRRGKEELLRTQTSFLLDSHARAHFLYDTA